ncbi:hypothetical protein C0995_001163 [Termitomyces sp. Mi166|nr:hypothetical protein C0995_001163 [Termitomyces sp. Mi166\
MSQYLLAFRKNLVKGPRNTDDINNTINNFDPSKNMTPPLDLDLKDAASKWETKPKHNLYFELDSEKIHRSRYLTQAFALLCKTDSTDHLKCVANGSWYFVKEEVPGIIEHDNESTGTAIHMDYPIASLVHCGDHFFICIGKVIDITFVNQHVNKISLKYLNEPLAFMTYQMLNIVSARIDNNPDEKHNWQWSCEHGASYKVAEHLVIAINPSVGEPSHLFESSVLMALGTTIFEQLNTHSKTTIPKVKQSLTFPTKNLEVMYS